MPGHSRTGGQEYFAPAVVLQQYEPNGEIDALVWDASAGNAFVHGYAIRDLGSRDTMVTDKDGNLVPGRTQYVIQSNIGQVLFSPAAMLGVEDDLFNIKRMIKLFDEQQKKTWQSVFERMDALEALVTQPANAKGEAAPAASLEAKSDPKGQTKRT